MAHEEALQRRHAGDRGKAEIAQQAQRRQVVGEQPVQRVGGGDQRHGVEATPALIERKDGRVADVEAEAARVADAYGQGRNVAQTEVQALTGNGMNAVQVGSAAVSDRWYT